MNTIKGHCIEAGDDAEGQPRIIIHTTREALRDGPAIVMKEVIVSVEEDSDCKAIANMRDQRNCAMDLQERAEKACAEIRDLTQAHFRACAALGITVPETFRKAVEDNRFGLSYVCLTDPVIEELVDALDNVDRHKGLLAGERAALAAYNARVKEARL